MSRKRKINWDKQLEYAQRQLDINKALIDDTNRGTKGQKPVTWTRTRNRSKIN